MSEVLVGTLLELRAGRGRVLARGGEEIPIRVPRDAGFGLRRFARYRFGGRYAADGAFEVESAARAEYRRPDYEALAAHGIGLAPGEIDALVERAGCRDLADYVRLWADRQTEARAAAALEEVVGAERAAGLAATFRQLAVAPDLEELREMLPFDEADVLKIHDFLRHRAARRKVSVAELLRRDPYHLVHVPDLEGGREAAWQAAERLAARLGLESATGRTAALAAMFLWQEAERGHAYCERKKVVGFLLHRAGKQMRWEYRDAESALASVLPQPGRTNEWPAGFFAWENKLAGPAVYLANAFHSERLAARGLARILGTPARVNVGAGELVRAAARLAAVPLDGQQRRFVRAVAENKVVLLDGEAGTGKTEVLAALARAWRELVGDEPAVVAPTGIAAQRLAERCGADRSFTIHRFAEIDRTAKDLALYDWTEEWPDEEAPGGKVDKWKASLVIVDEMSMADVVAFGRLVHRCLPGCRLVLAGDGGQLPPVGPGPVFKELLALAGKNMPGLARVTLEEPRRQEDRELLEFARRVRRGEFPPPPGGGAVRLVETPPEYAHRAAVDVAVGIWQEHGPGSVMVLTPRAYGDRRRKTETGAALLNEELKQALNPAAPLLGTEFSAGDPVLAIVNDYEPTGNEVLPYPRAPRGTVFNGTLGTVTGVYAGEGVERPCLEVDFGGGWALYYAEEVPRFLAPAYACTVHKAQGAGVDHVVVVLDDAGGWGRDLLYTALTRARKTVTLVGPRRAYEEMAAREPADCRSTLGRRLERLLFGEEPGAAAAARSAAAAPEVVPYVAAAADPGE